MILIFSLYNEEKMQIDILNKIIVPNKLKDFSKKIDLDNNSHYAILLTQKNSIIIIKYIDIKSSIIFFYN